MSELSTEQWAADHRATFRAATAAGSDLVERIRPLVQQGFCEGWSACEVQDRVNQVLMEESL